MQNSKGEVLENMMNGPAISYLHGDGKILPGLERQLTGLAVGEYKYINLCKADYPGLDDDLELEVVIDDVRIASEEELSNGISQQVVGEICDEDCICYDRVYNQ
ncbi:hypothetical protein [Olivibacter ginsenosidimutans]